MAINENVNIIVKNEIFDMNLRGGLSCHSLTYSGKSQLKARSLWYKIKHQKEIQSKLN